MCIQPHDRTSLHGNCADIFAEVSFSMQACLIVPACGGEPVDCAHCLLPLHVEQCMQELHIIREVLINDVVLEHAGHHHQHQKAAACQAQCTSITFSWLVWDAFMVDMPD